MGMVFVNIVADEIVLVYSSVRREEEKEITSLDVLYIVIVKRPKDSEELREVERMHILLFIMDVEVAHKIILDYV